MLLVTGGSTVIDSAGFGRSNGFSFSNDTVYLSPITRTPDTDRDTGNIGDFSVVSGFAANQLGDPPCFAEGALIATPHSAKPVEELQIGDRILTDQGIPTVVKWVGRRKMHRSFLTKRTQLVRIGAGALGKCKPQADLIVTVDHAMLIEGVLCNASTLVNGTTITQVPQMEMGDTFTVYHIETEGMKSSLQTGRRRKPTSTTPRVRHLTTTLNTKHCMAKRPKCRNCRCPVPPRRGRCPTTFTQISKDVQPHKPNTGPAVSQRQQGL